MEFRESSCPQVDLSGPPPSVTALIQNITSNMSVFGYNDEYDPLRPNDYNKIKEQRKRETERERHQEEPPKGLYDVDDEDDVDDNQISTKESNERSVNKKGNAFAPPPSLIEEDKRASNINNNETSWFQKLFFSSTALCLSLSYFILKMIFYLHHRQYHKRSIVQTTWKPNLTR